MWPRKRRPPPADPNGKDTLSDAQQSSRDARDALEDVSLQLGEIHARAARITELTQRIETELRRNGFAAAIQASLRKDHP